MVASIRSTPKVPTRPAQARRPDLVKLPDVAAREKFVVSAGDTLQSLARELGVSLQDLRDANPKICTAARDNGARLWPGDELRLPRMSEAAPRRDDDAQAGHGRVALRQDARTGKPSRVRLLDVPAGKKLVVSAGDTLQSLARELGVSLQDLRNANPEICTAARNNGARLWPGDELRLPMADAMEQATSSKLDVAPAGPPHRGTAQGAQTRRFSLVKHPELPAAQVHVVSKGETLTKIARTLGVSLSALRNANPELCGGDRQKGNLIFPRDEVRIPPKATPSPAQAASTAPVAQVSTPSSATGLHWENLATMFDRCDASKGRELTRGVVTVKDIRGAVQADLSKMSPGASRQKARAALHAFFDARWETFDLGGRGTDNGVELKRAMDAILDAWG